MQFYLHNVGIVGLALHHHNSYTLLCRFDVTKWMEARALPSAIGKVVVQFLHEEIFTRFRIPRELVTDIGA